MHSSHSRFGGYSSFTGSQDAGSGVRKKTEHFCGRVSATVVCGALVDTGGYGSEEHEPSVIKHRIESPILIE